MDQILILFMISDLFKIAFQILVEEMNNDTDILRRFNDEVLDLLEKRIDEKINEDIDPEIRTLVKTLSSSLKKSVFELIDIIELEFLTLTPQEAEMRKFRMIEEYDEMYGKIEILKETIFSSINNISENDEMEEGDVEEIEEED